MKSFVSKVRRSIKSVNVDRRGSHRSSRLSPSLQHTSPLAAAANAAPCYVTTAFHHTAVHGSSQRTHTNSTTFQVDSHTSRRQSRSLAASYYRLSIINAAPVFYAASQRCRTTSETHSVSEQSFSTNATTPHNRAVYKLHISSPLRKTALRQTISRAVVHFPSGWGQFRLEPARRDFSAAAAHRRRRTCVSYAEARLSYRLDVCPSVCPSVCHTLVLYQNG